MGTIEEPINQSKGCGGVMRVAPAGLIFESPEEAFRLGCEVAAITHGHPSGCLAAGCLAAIVAHIISGSSLLESIQGAMVITGDITQIDLPHGRLSGLIEAEKILRNTEGIKFVYFSERDVVRHKLVQEIVKAYEKYEKRTTEE